MNIIKIKKEESNKIEISTFVENMDERKAHYFETVLADIKYYFSSRKYNSDQKSWTVESNDEVKFNNFKNGLEKRGFVFEF